MRPRAALALVVVAALASGCSSSGPKLSTTQIESLQVREVNASSDRAFSAVANAMVDAGYSARVSDSDAGLLTGYKLVEHSDGRKILVAVLTRGSGRVPPDVLHLCAVVSEAAPGRSNVRIQTYLNGVASIDQAFVEEFWVLVQRQVLMKEPIQHAP
jgi:hypothetical protein